uniref:Tetratricopeptide repeat protein 5 OB fold domain-containing protein n=1 Tax=Lotharella oceanica TaxID=641309 RepID=A0A7S2XC01_9EUKA
MSSETDPVATKDAVERSIEKLEKLSKQYSLSEAERGRRMRKLIAQVCKWVDSIDHVDAESKAQAACWKGRAYSTLAEYTPEAEEYLTKAIKLEPALVEAWNSLGAEYWKKKDLKAAGDCFRGALEQKKNKVSLRKLSMVVRNHGEPKTYRERLAESVDLAKEAIKLDVKDGESWYVLGNAYMMQFFTSFSTDDLEGCLKAYETAEKSTVDSASKNPDLYYNRANVHKFYEQYQKAIDDYKKSRTLDPHLPAQDEVENIHRFVKKLSKLIATKNGIKAKRRLKLKELIPETSQIKDVERREFVDLKQGPNKGSFLVGVIISPVTRTWDSPVSFIVMDKNTDMFVLSVYGVVSSLQSDLKMGDVIYINQPVLKQISVNEFKERVYPCISVGNAVNLSVNGKPLPKKAFANPSVKVSTFSTSFTKEGKVSQKAKSK